MCKIFYVYDFGLFYQNLKRVYRLLLVSLRGRGAYFIYFVVLAKSFGDNLIIILSENPGNASNYDGKFFATCAKI